jgi:large subunit ribosomal protein L24
MKIHKNDTVMIIAGKDATAARRAGKALPQGVVKQVFPKTNKVVVEGLNIVKRHRRQGMRGARQAGIIELEAPIDVSNVMIVCGKCGKPTRIAAMYIADGSKARQCRHCQEVLEDRSRQRQQ